MRTKPERRTGHWPAAVIFDCDGVLIDSWEATCYFYNRIRSSVGLGPMSSEEEAFVFTSTIPQGIRHIIPEALRESARAAWTAVEPAELVARIQPQPGILPLLARLKEKGILIGVHTNGGSEAYPILDGLKLRPYFDAVVTADEVTRPKPSPEGAWKLLDAWNLSPEDAVFIGDSDIDRQTARAAGLSFWAYRNPGLEADRHISDFTSLRQELFD